MLHEALRATICGLAALLALAAPARALEVQLRERAELRGPTYTLGELAELRDAANPAALARWAALVIGQSPRNGQSEIVTREALGEVLRRLDVPAPAWSGAQQTLLRARGQPLAAERVADAAAAALFAAWSPTLQGLEARPAGPLPEVTVPPGTLTLEARLPEGASLARRMLVHVDVRVDGVPVTHVPVWFAVRAMRTVRLSRAGLQRGEAPAEAAFERAVRDVTAYDSPPLPADAPLEGLRLRHALAAEMPLTRAAVEARPAVVRNEPVRVRVQTGAVRLETVGIALADARIGEQVRVMNPASHDAYAGRVVADGTVLASER